MTTRSKRSAKSAGVEALIGQDGEMLRRLLQEALQQVLEAEMAEAVGAGRGERTAVRLGYCAGCYSRGLVTRSRINTSLDGVLPRFAERLFRVN